MRQAVEIEKPPGGQAPATAPSEGVSRPAVLTSGLEVVVALAQRLPVLLVPEETLVSSVWNDVVNHCRLHIPRRVLHQALDAERMLLKEQPACSLPSPAVATLRSRACNLRVKRQMLITIYLVAVNKLRASRMSAGFSWFVWHLVFTSLRLSCF